MRILIVTLLLNLSLVYASAQSLKVDGTIERLTMNAYASKNSRIGKNGDYCGLLLVNSTIKNLQFSGNVAGDIKFNSGAYYVYLDNGTRLLTCSTPTGESVTIHLPEIESKTTYEVTIYKEIVDKGKGRLVCNSSPKGANVTLISETTGDEISFGTTPVNYNMKVRADTYTVQISKPKYQTEYIKNVVIRPDKATNIGIIKLSKQKK